jgi:hypothetical protein
MNLNMQFSWKCEGTFSSSSPLQVIISTEQGVVKRIKNFSVNKNISGWQSGYVKITDSVVNEPLNIKFQVSKTENSGEFYLDDINIIAN